MKQLSKRIVVAALFSATPLFAASKMVYTTTVDDQMQIAEADGDGSHEKLLTSGKNTHIFPKITADGKQVAWSEGPSTADLGIVLYDRERGQIEEYSEVKGWNLHLNFSGNGRYLAFSSPRGTKGRAVIVIVDLQQARAQHEFQQIVVNGQQRLRYTGKPRIVEEEYPLYFPSPSSDGQFLVYQRSLDRDRKEVIYLDLEKGTKKRLTPENGFAMAPCLSFDDRFVVFSGRLDGQSDLYWYDFVTNSIKRLTNDPVHDAEPVFRPDGGVVFASPRDNQAFGLYEITAESIRNGTLEVKPLVSRSGGSFAPSISGDLAAVQGALAPMLEPFRSSFGVTRVGTKIFIAGGHRGHEHTYPPESFLDKLEYYDISDGKWHQAAPRPVSAHGYTLATYGKYIYAFGGFAYSPNHTPKWKSLDQIDRFDTESNTWVTVGKLPRARSSNVVGVVDGKAYLIGGWDSTPKRPGDLDGTFHRAIDVFDLKTETSFVSEVQLPDPLRRAFTAVTVGDEIILLGGLGVGASHFNLLDQVTGFNVRQKTFRELPKLPFATFAPAAGVIGDHFYVFGGMYKVSNDDYRYVNHIFGLKMGDPTWVHTGRYLTENKGFSGVAPLENGRLAVIGGHTYDEHSDRPVRTVEVFGF